MECALRGFNWPKANMLRTGIRFFPVGAGTRCKESPASIPALYGLQSAGSSMSESCSVCAEGSGKTERGKPGETRGSAIAPNRLFNLPELVRR